MKQRIVFHSRNQWFISYNFEKENYNNIYLYRCTVHSVFYLINTPTNAHMFI